MLSPYLIVDSFTCAVIVSVPSAAVVSVAAISFSGGLFHPYRNFVTSSDVVLIVKVAGSPAATPVDVLVMTGCLGTVVSG